MILVFSALTGCAGMPRIILTTGFRAGEVFRVGRLSGYDTELSLYAASLASEYAETLPVTDVRDVIRENALALATQIKAMCLLAEENGVALSDEEKERAAAASAAFYATLTEDDIRALNGLAQESVRQMYEECALADRVYAYAIRDVNPEISDDEARTITVEYIRMDKKDAPERARDKAEEAYERIEAGEDFAAMIALYNEADTERATFGMGDQEEIPETAAFALATGEVSRVLETKDAYYILRCVSAFDREETRVNKTRIVARRHNEVFGELYDAFVQGLPVQLNEGAFDAFTVPVLSEEAADFWEMYERFFGEED